MYRRGVLIGVLLAASLVFSSSAAAQTSPAPVKVSFSDSVPSAAQSGTTPPWVVLNYLLEHYSEESSHFGIGGDVLFPWCPTTSVVASFNQGQSEALCARTDRI